jgi:hypothetical protein
MIILDKEKDMNILKQPNYHKNMHIIMRLLQTLMSYSSAHRHASSFIKINLLTLFCIQNNQYYYATKPIFSSITIIAIHLTKFHTLTNGVLVDLN